MRISKQIQIRHKLTDEFLLGCLNPDIKKLIGEDRIKTHYMYGTLDSQIDIDGYCKKYKDKIDYKNNFYLGELAHLLQDKIWFTDYCHTENVSV